MHRVETEVSSLSKPLLTDEQLSFYEKNGYIVIRNLIPQSDILKWKNHFLNLCHGKIRPVDTMTVMKDVSVSKNSSLKGEIAITKVQDFQDDETLFSYCQHPLILRYINALIGKRVKSIHTMLIQKPPGVGESGRHPLHQDLIYFPHRPANKVICSWTAMEKVTRDNGCLVVLPGSHDTRLLSHSYPEWDGGVNKAYFGIQDKEVLDRFMKGRVHLEMDAGDTVFFHPQLIHGSGWNKTQGYRKSISCHYAAADCEYVDVKGTVQEQIAEELEGMALRKFKKPISFQELWKSKSRVVTE